MLANTLLPQPDSYVVIDRQRASANGFLVAPLATRNFVNLQHLLPKYMFVPPSAIAKYRNLSPTQFGVNKNVKPGTALPFYTLFNEAPTATVATGTPVIRTNTSNGQSFSVAFVPLLPAPSSSSTSSSGSTTTAGYVTSTSSSSSAATPSSSTASSGTTTSQAAQSSSTSGTATQTPAQALIAAANALASGQTGTTNSPNNLVPAGTLTPVASTTSTASTTPATTSSASTSSGTGTTAAGAADNRDKLVDPGGFDDRVSGPGRVQQHERRVIDDDLVEYHERDTDDDTEFVGYGERDTNHRGHQLHRRRGVSAGHGHDTRAKHGNHGGHRNHVADLDGRPAGIVFANPGEAAAANKKQAAQLAASQKKVVQKKSFWTKLWNSL